MKSHTAHRLVLGIHPTSRGFGWVLFEGPDSPVDWGIASAKATRSARPLSRFKRLLRRYEPSVVVFEEFEGHGTRRSDRIQKLCREMVHLAQLQRSDTPIFSRAAVRSGIGNLSADATRYEIAQAVAEQIPALQKRLPPKRKPWMSEDARQCLFDAAALAITYFRSL